MTHEYVNMDTQNLEIGDAIAKSCALSLSIAVLSDTK